MGAFNVMHIFYALKLNSYLIKHKMHLDIK